MNKSLCFLGHLGLGDHLIVNAIVRHLAKEREKVLVLCKERNAPSVEFMFRDLQNVIPVAQPGDGVEQAKAWADQFESDGGDVLRIGMYGENFTFTNWDRCMYRQAQVPFDWKWSKFFVAKTDAPEIAPPEGEYAFVHDDPTRGFTLDRNLIGCPIQISPSNAGHMFQWRDVIEKASEIHCIDSSFANLVDMMPTEDFKTRKFVLHLYARTGANPPTWGKDWDILR